MAARWLRGPVSNTWARLAAYPFVLAALMGAVAGLGALVDHRLPDAWTSHFRVGWFLSFASAAPITLALRHRWDGRNDHLGLNFRHGWAGLLGMGMLVGGAIQAILWTSLLFSGTLGNALSGEANTRVGLFMAQSAMLLAHAFFEETTFRGYIFQNLREAIGTRRAFWSTCVLFSLCHVVDPGGAQILVVLNLMLAGALFGYAYLATGRLWPAIGLHFAWNLFEGPVFGMTVSGHDPLSFVVSRLHGPAWTTGGAFGPEASVWLLPAELAGFSLLWLLFRRGSGATD